MKHKNPAKKKKQNLNKRVEVRLPADYGWKVLGNLAKDLCYLLTESENSRLNGIIRSRCYSDYLALSEEWGPQSIRPCCVPALGNMRAKYQIVALLKKFRFSSERDTRIQAATNKLLAAEESCRVFNQNGWKHLSFAEDDHMCNVYTYARGFLKKVLGDVLPSRAKLTLWSRHGPGANLDTKNGHTNTYFKYSEWPYSCTKDALGWARLAIEDDERWLGALEDSYRERNNIPRHEILNRERFWSSVFSIVPGNRIAFVPKNAQTERSIAIEPSMNLYLQLGVDGYIRRRLRRWGIDIDSQEKNKELARLGSLNWESKVNFVTLDLAAASDSISVRLCRELLPKQWYDYLTELRSPLGDLNGESISYEKISSMGNGFTFALETLIFASIVYGVQREYQGSYNSETCAIFGDDIIVENTISAQLVTALNLCGFNTNLEKSFYQGPFRESCGSDWFNGRPVRPVFLTSLPTTVMELWCDVNRLRRILKLRFGLEESNVEKCIDQWIPNEFGKLTGPISDEDFDSYKHSEVPNGIYQYWVWKFRRLVVRPKPIKGSSFLFRKLMHNLRGEQFDFQYKNSSNSYFGKRITGSGSRFIVTRPHLVTIGYTFSSSDYWRTEYTESMPCYSLC